MASNKTITMGPEQYSSQDELAWTAFQYHVGELSADQAEAFEEDLFVDQAAREALAEVVALAETLDLSDCLRQEPFAPGKSTPCPTPARRNNRPRWQSFWATVAVTVSIGLVLTAYCFWVNTGGQSQVAKATGSEVAVAQAWASTQIVRLEDVQPNGLEALPFEEEDPEIDPVVDPASLVPVFPNLYLAKGTLKPADIREEM